MSDELEPLRVGIAGAVQAFYCPTYRSTILGQFGSAKSIASSIWPLYTLPTICIDERQRLRFSAEGGPFDYNRTACTCRDG